MESLSSVKLVTVIVLIKVLWCGIGESQPCSPGFGSDLFPFGVPREHLQRDTRIGTIVFDDCSGRTRTIFDSADKRVHVASDGTVKLKRQVTLHNGHKMFSVHAWDSRGKKHTALVRVEHQGRAGHHHGQQEDVGAVEAVQTESSSVLPLLEFPKSGGLRRRKREWVIPPISISENDRGPFPKQMVQIKSSHARETKMVYRISGEGADQPPVGLFTIDRNTGWLYVSRPLDRETKDKYVLQVSAHSVTDNIIDPAMEVIIQVLDQNDNRPVFTQDPFVGSVPEASKIGFEFMTVSATDADDPNTDNADIRYSILGQIPPEPSPNMFEINPVSGAIRVNAAGLDRVTYPEYTLEIKAADIQGHGLSVTGKAVITVTGSSDKDLQKAEWAISPVRISENERGHFPKEILQIKFSHAKIPRVKYSISGMGADLPPVGLFLMDKNTGMLYTARPLDRETKDKYVLQAHIVGDNMYNDFVEFTIDVIDQNDNKPVFTQDPFIGSVSDASKIGFEFLTISAIDADDPNTDNADIRYSIISQSPSEPSPNMFAINPVTGVIRVNAEGLDSEKYSKYVLEIQAADMQGNGLSSKGTAVILVTDGKDVTLTAPRTWEISPICFPENYRGPFPKQLTQIKSRHAKQTKIVYSISGEGADQPPVGLFTISKDSGWLSVTKPLDRETKHEYVLQVRATRDEQPTEITICVIDQNDNKPVFTQDPFRGSVPEGSNIGFEFMTISATDADDPKTENANIRYSIISQDPALPQPNMFEINPISGEIQVNAEGLDRKKYPEYTLEIQAADMQGNGLQSRGKAVITVTV
ncbi:EP-cadherin isoform X3 [Pangasianodon hypophthalmus]|uniref:EP-cadherin isoform X3 n=1 Tax=Pangasianodon hypophthalmus TaxID=310915 RepID=UPI002307A967|nr:EP-cadherin isoform X3 [Pangasianodon hypophthalmus]XP_026802550.3 EP-cadherin isoform X3 [Pangasianodon hypophthalmus]